jgi:hypothetical protein
LNRAGWGRARRRTSFYLAGGNAFFFLLDLDDQILLDANMPALVTSGLLIAGGLVASAVIAAMPTTAATATKQATTPRQTELLALVGVAAMFDFLGLHDRNADAFTAASAVMAATAWTAGFHDNGIVGPQSAGLSPDAQDQSAQRQGE